MKPVVRLSVVSLLLLAGAIAVLGQSIPRYRNAALPIGARVKDLLKRMTLEEKVAQLESTWQNHQQDLGPDGFFVDEKGQLDEEKARRIFKDGLGQMSRPSETHGQPTEMAEFANRMRPRLHLSNR